MKKLIVSLDIFKYDKLVHYKSQTSYGTIIGGIFSVIFILIWSTIVFFFLKNIFMKMNVKVDTYPEYLENEPLLLNTFPFVFAVDNDGLYTNKTVYTIKANLIIHNQFFEIPLALCSDIFILGQSKERDEIIC